MCRIAAFQAAQGDDRAFFNEIQSLKSLSGFSVVRETSDCALGSTANRISGSKLRRFPRPKNHSTLYGVSAARISLR